MKALFIKDLGLMKGQKQFFAVVLIMMTVFLSAYTDYSFVIAYITVMFGIMTLSTISYDDQDNGLGYLFALPVSRRDYVKEKYLFSFATTIPGTILVTVFALVVSRIRKIDFCIEEWVTMVTVSLLIVVVTLVLMIPIHLKFGAERSRLALMILFGGGSLTIYAAVKLCDALGIDYISALDWLADMSPAVTLTGLALICTVLLGISYRCSIMFIEAREF